MELCGHGLRIRPGMDVYGAYQDEYIGTVSAVSAQGERAAPSTEPLPPSSPSSASEAPLNPELVYPRPVYEETTPIVGKLGEEMGPFPTMAVGNTGPVNQSAQHQYATSGEPVNVTWFEVRPGRLNLGPLTRSLYIPTSAVRSVSMERIVLKVQKDQIPAEWWNARPT